MLATTYFWTSCFAVMVAWGSAWGSKSLHTPLTRKCCNKRKLLPVLTPLTNFPAFFLLTQNSDKHSFITNKSFFYCCYCVSLLEYLFLHIFHNNQRFLDILSRGFPFTLLTLRFMMRPEPISILLIYGIIFNNIMFLY